MLYTPLADLVRMDIEPLGQCGQRGLNDCGQSDLRLVVGETFAREASQSTYPTCSDSRRHLSTPKQGVQGTRPCSVAARGWCTYCGNTFCSRRVGRKRARPGRTGALVEWSRAGVRHL